jgi:hypothetical protein
MEYQEAKEKIAIKIYASDNLGPSQLQEHEREQYREKAAQILSVLFAPAEIEEWKKGGYPAMVKKDQTPPIDNSGMEASVVIFIALILLLNAISWFVRALR